MSTPELVQSFVDGAREYVRRAIGVELDGTPESLAFVDHYVERCRTPALADDLLALTATALGAYFGELAIARFGGHWVLDGDPASWQVALEVGDLRIRPVAIAALALRSGEVEGYDGSLSTRPEWMDRLADALAQAPPVDQDYYYSLTGRFETLEHAADLLTELGRTT